MPDFARRPLGAFLDALGSASPEPGGGAAAALTGATGMALAEMTARINAKKKGKTARVAQAAAYRKRLVRLMALDARAFAEISRLYKAKNSRVLQGALKIGAQVPMEILEVCLKGLALCAAERSRTGKWLASDLVEAGILLEASIRAARLNVEINLKGLSDRRFVKKARTRLAVVERKASTRTREIRKVLS